MSQCSLMIDYWYWAAMAVPAFFLAYRQRTAQPHWVLLTCASLIWFAAFLLTDDRRMFFPFSMQSAAAAGSTAPAISLAVLFVTIRIAQDASMQVLAVEVLVVCAALGFAHWLRKRYGHPWAVLGCALLALAGLAVN